MIFEAIKDLIGQGGPGSWASSKKTPRTLCKGSPARSDCTSWAGPLSSWPSAGVRVTNQRAKARMSRSTQAAQLGAAARPAAARRRCVIVWKSIDLQHDHQRRPDPGGAPGGVPAAPSAIQDGRAAQWPNLLRPNSQMARNPETGSPCPRQDTRPPTTSSAPRRHHIPYVLPYISFVPFCRVAGAHCCAPARVRRLQHAGAVAEA